MAMPPSPAASFLRTIPLFQDLSEREIEEVAWTAQPFTCEPGERLFRQGATAEEMYCLERGRVQLSMRMAGAEEVAIADLGPGDFLGEMALLDRGTRSATAVALERTTGYKLPGRAFEVLRAAHRPGALKVLRRLARIGSVRLRAMTRDAFGGIDAAAAAVEPVREGIAVASGRGGEERIRALRGSTAGLDREVLLFLPAFRDFSRQQLEDLLEEMHRVALPRRHVVFREGDPPGSCFVVVRGAVEVSVERAGRTEKLALLGPGRIFGELALFDPHPRAATCTTRESTLLLELEGRKFDELFATHSVVAFKFFEAAYQLLVEALRNANRRWIWLAAQDRFAGRRSS